MSKLGNIILVLILVIVVTFSFAAISLVRNERLMEHLNADYQIGADGTVFDWIFTSGSDFNSQSITYSIDDRVELPIGETANKIDIDATVANITVQPTENGEAYSELVGEVTYSGDVKPYLYVRNQGDRFIVKVNYGDSGSMNILQSGLELRIYLPQEVSADLEIATVSGEVAVSDLSTGQVEIRTISGNVDIKYVYTDEIEVESVSGNVNIEQSRLASDYDIKTVSGNVSVAAEDETELQLDYSSISGEGIYDYPFNEIMEIDDNELQLMSGSGEFEMRVRTTSGDFRLYLKEK